VHRLKKFDMFVVQFVPACKWEVVVVVVFTCIIVTFVVVMVGSVPIMGILGTVAGVIVGWVVSTCIIVLVIVGMVIIVACHCCKIIVIAIGSAVIVIV